jgi:hypothetical protein
MSSRVGVRGLLLAGCAASLLLAGCAASSTTPAFDLHRGEPGAAEQALLAEILGAPVTSDDAGPARVAAVGPDGLSLHDASSGKRLWRIAAQPDTAPLLRGELVLFARAGKLFAHSVADGRLRFAVPLGRDALLGAALGDGRLVVSAADRGLAGTERGARLLALDARDGSVEWEHALPGRIGAPALRGGFVFVPWNFQSLSVLDARTGRERLRLGTRQSVVRWVSSEAAGVAFGDRDLRLVSTGGAALNGPALALDANALPGQPPLRPSSYEPLPAPGSADSQLGLHFALAPAAPARLRADGSYLVFFRHVFGFEPSGRLRFARVLGSDVVQAQPTETGLLVVTRSGELSLLDARDGRPRLAVQLGFEPLAAALEVRSLGGGEPSEAPASLRAMLLALALDADSRLVPTRAFAARALATLPEPEVTRDLLDIYRQGSTPQGLTSVVAQQLRLRTSGAEYLIAALAERQDFLEQTRPAPLEAVVPALEQMGARQALPRLVERMLDPETPLAQLPTVVHAVGVLGERDALEPLRYLLRLYRADSSFAGHPEALIEAARALARLGGEPERAPLQALASASGTQPALAEAIGRLWSPEAEAPAALAATPAAAPAAAPTRLSEAELHAVLSEHVAELRACVLEELGRNPRLSRLRIAFVAQPDGTPRGMSLSPNGPELSACLLPRLEALRFAGFEGERHVIDFVIAVRAFAPEPLQLATPVQEGPWWEAALARGGAEPEEGEGAARGEAWWKDRNTLGALVEAAAGGGSSTGTSTRTRTTTSTDAGAGAGTGAGAGAGTGTGAEPAAVDAWWTPAQ